MAADCSLMVHDECLSNVRVECPVWRANLQRMQLEKLQALFPNLNKTLVSEVLAKADSIEVAINVLMREEEKKKNSIM